MRNRGDEVLQRDARNKLKDKDRIQDEGDTELDRVAAHTQVG